MEKQKELEEKELEKERNREKERERIDREFEKKKERDNEKREGHLKAKEELDREKEERDKMRMKEKEDKDRQREKEREFKDKMREKEKDERKRLEEKNRRDREEKERMKQREKEEKFKLKEERDKQRLKEREEREKEKKREKEKREKEKQKLRDERKRYNERFNSGYKLTARNLRNSNSKNKINPFNNLHQTRSQGNYYQRQAYNSNKLYVRKRRYSHRRIQPKNRIPRVDPKKNLGKTSMKIIKPKRYDEEETDSEVTDFEYKLMRFPKFKAKYGKNFVLKKPSKNKFVNLTSYISNNSGKNIIDYKRPEMEYKMGETKQTNLTISEVEEEEEKNHKKRRMPLSKVKPKNAKFNMNKKMKEILGKQYKLLVNDPLNPYGTYWPSNFLKVGYDTGFEYDNFHSGVPVLKLKSLGKKPLPPIKKRGQGMHFNNDGSAIYSPNKNGLKHPFPNTTAKKNNNDDLGKDEKDNNIKVNKSQTIKVNNDNLLKDKNNNNES